MRRRRTKYDLEEAMARSEKDLHALMKRQLEENHEICRMKRIEKRIKENKLKLAIKYSGKVILSK